MTSAIRKRRIILTGPSEPAKIFQNGKFSWDGEFSHRCSDIPEQKTGGLKADITPSCAVVLKMTGILCRLLPGDEGIMPSCTFFITYPRESWM